MSRARFALLLSCASCFTSIDRSKIAPVDLGVDASADSSADAALPLDGARDPLSVRGFTKGSNAGPLSLLEPSEEKAGDVLLAFVATRSESLNAPDGWNEVWRASNPTGATLVAAVFARRASSPGASHLWETASGASTTGAIVAFQGAALPVRALEAEFAPDVATVVSPASPASPSELAVAMFASNGARPRSVDPPFAKLLEEDYAATDGCQIVIATAAGAGAELSAASNDTAPNSSNFGVLTVIGPPP